MKKTLLLAGLILLSLIQTYAQISATVASTNAQIGDSFIANSDIKVSPYVSLLKPYCDQNITFRLGTGTKFVITDIIPDDNKGTAGYVITVWNFEDPKDQDKASEKRKFYNTILDAQSKISTDERALKKAVTDKQSDLDNLKADIVVKSQNLEKLKTDLATTQQSLTKETELFYGAIQFIDIDKNLTSPPLVNGKAVSIPEVSNFSKERSNAAESPSKNETLITPDNSLIQAGLKLPATTNVTFEKYKSEFSDQKKKAAELSDKIKSGSDELTTESNQIPAKEAELGLAKKSYSIFLIQNSNPDNSQNWKIKKSDIGDPEDVIPADDKNPAAVYEKLAYIDSWANKWQFYITSQDFLTKTTTIYPSSFKFTWGFLTLPLKMRFDNNIAGRFNFEQNLNFGLTLGIKQQLVRKNDVSWNYLGGISVVNVPLNDAIPGTNAIPANTTTNTPAVAAVPATPATSTTAISMSLGAMFQYDKFQFGTFIGFDFAGQSANNKFAYQGKPWLGFAIGVSLFGEGKTTATPQTQNSN